MGIVDSYPGKWLPIDDYTGARVDIDVVHSQIHNGKHYTTVYSKALSAGSNLAVAITTPTAGTGYVHFVAGVDSNLSGTWYFTEGASISAGSTLTAYNNNRISTSTAGTVTVGTPTVTTYGTVIETHVVGTNTTPSQTGGGTKSRNEYILATASTYMVYFTANATSTFSAITFSYYVES